jgi:hypothetical protein
MTNATWKVALTFSNPMVAALGITPYQRVRVTVQAASEAEAVIRAKAHITSKYKGIISITIRSVTRG